MRNLRKDFAKLLCVSLLAPVVVHALNGFEVEGGQVGQRVLTLAIDDSVRLPDLSKLQVSGHQIQAAVFIEEYDLPFVVSPNLVDAVADPTLRVIRQVRPGLYEFESSAGFLPRQGMILSDTALGGVLVRVNRFEPTPGKGGFRRRWMLETVPAALTDAIFSCDLFFSTDINLNLAFRERKGSREVEDIGTGAGLPENGLLEFSLLDGKVLASPRLTGRLRINDGRVEVFTSSVEGEFEYIGKMESSLQGVGNYRLEEALPEGIAINIPLEKGLFLRISHRAQFIVEASSITGTLTGRAGLDLKSRVRSSLDFAKGEWNPTSHYTLLPNSKTRQHVEGEGSMKLTLQSNLDVRLNGRQGPVHIFEPYMRLSSESLSSAPASPFDPAGRGTNRFVNVGLHSHLFLGVNLDGEAVRRNFQVFSRELPFLAPPARGALSLREVDSSQAVLVYHGPPGVEAFQVQVWEEGQWWNWSESPGPRIRLSGLAPGKTYRVRVVGINAMGSGEPFPQDGLSFTTAQRNQPPFVPEAYFPYPGALAGQLNIELSWKGGDPDGDEVFYDVYLDTLLPPKQQVSQGIKDSSHIQAGLKPGTRYYWKIVANDGNVATESPTWSFTTLEAPQVAKPRVHPEPSEMLFLPGGSFLRKDGRRVEVRKFFLQKYEVNQADFRKVMGINPSHHHNDAYPVEKVLWEEAATYCREIGGRLPTEAEWEYAARAGFSGGDFWGNPNPDQYAWYFTNSSQRTHRVGKKDANPWGLHDVLGNVSEWVQDWYGEYSPDDLDNPTGPETGTTKVVRGASWYSEPQSLNPTKRFSNRPGFRNYKVGFRCAADVGSDDRISSTDD